MIIRTNKNQTELRKSQHFKRMRQEIIYSTQFDLDMPFKYWKYKCELNQNTFLHSISYRDNIGIMGGICDLCYTEGQTTSL